MYICLFKQNVPQNIIASGLTINYPGFHGSTVMSLVETWSTVINKLNQKTIPSIWRSYNFLFCSWIRFFLNWTTRMVFGPVQLRNDKSPHRENHLFEFSLLPSEIYSTYHNISLHVRVNFNNFKNKIWNNNSLMASITFIKNAIL